MHMLLFHFINQTDFLWLYWGERRGLSLLSPNMAEFHVSYLQNKGVELEAF